MSVDGTSGPQEPAGGDPEPTQTPTAPATTEQPDGAPTGGGSAEDRTGGLPGFVRAGVESVLLVALAVIMAVLIKTFLVQAFYIPSASMEPGLVKNDRILVQKWSYWRGGPERGDVIVFADPGDWLPAEEQSPPTGTLTGVLTKIGLYPTGGHLVKRVIGVPGDVITCCDQQGRIAVNGTPLDEPYLKNDGACNSPMRGCDWKAGPVPPGRLFVLGDHRDNSADSRFHMCAPKQEGCDPDDAYVPEDLVVGKVFVRIWPAGRFGFLHRPETFDDIADPGAG